MMKTTWNQQIVMCIAVAALSTTLTLARNANGDEPKPVEPDMHEFMEYMFEPGYKRLKVAMAKAPADRAGWKVIKGDSLALAEAANLLLSRGPDGKQEAWAKLAVAVRGDGAAFYQAAKKRDFESASKSYRSMLESCNKCHQAFANGKHQLVP